jgi:hypothetical protein
VFWGITSKCCVLRAERDRGQSRWEAASRTRELGLCDEPASLLAA